MYIFHMLIQYVCVFEDDTGQTHLVERIEYSRKAVELWRWREAVYLWSQDLHFSVEVSSSFNERNKINMFIGSCFVKLHFID